MALHWRPVGPEPAQTYWLRRAVVAALVLLPLVLLLSLLGGDDGQERLATSPPASRPLPSQVSTSDPTASPSASPTPSAVPCEADVVRIEALADEEAYDLGATPRLALRVTNTGSGPCVRDLGQAAVELLVVSGSDRIWSSDDCAPGGEADPTVLEPGASEVSTVTWPGTRSEPGCDGGQEAASAGTYRVSGRVGELREQGTSFILR